MIRLLTAVSAIALAAVLAAPPVAADPGSDLAYLMPRGYTGETCHAFDAPGALLAENCDPIPGGPDRGVFILVDSPANSNQHFQNIHDGSGDPPFVATPCPGMPTADTASWAGGRWGCGTLQGTPVIMYTNGPMVAMLSGPDLGALNEWWKSAALR